MPSIIYFLVGLYIGVLLGVILLSLIVISDDDDRITDQVPPLTDKELDQNHRFEDR